MSTELAVATERGKSMAELMGVSSEPTSTATPNYARVNLLSSAIMGTNEKGQKLEVVPTGSFSLSLGEEITYAQSVIVRIFATRERWQRWNNDTGKMEKTVLANSVWKGDYKDNLGGMNLGRKPGFTSKEEYQALPQHIKDINRIKVFFGTITLIDPVNADGTPKNGLPSDIPFVFDLKNTPSIKSIQGILNGMAKNNLLPPMQKIRWDGYEASNDKNTWGQISALLDEPMSLQDSDNDTLKNFLEVIELQNAKILEDHYAANKDGPDADAKVVNEILDNDFVEVDG